MTCARVWEKPDIKLCFHKQVVLGWTLPSRTEVYDVKSPFGTNQCILTQSDFTEVAIEHGNLSVRT